MSSSTTSRLGLYKASPGTSEPVNVASLNGNFDIIDTLVVPEVCTSTTRPVPAFHNQLIRETDTKKMYIWNATQGEWDQIILDHGTLIARAAATGSPIATASTTETVIITTAQKVFPANRAFEVRVRSQVNASAILDVTPRVRKGLLITGSPLADYGRVNIPVSGNDRYFDFSAIFVTGASAVTTEMAFTAQTSTGTLQYRGFSSGPLEVRINQIGRASDYSTGSPVLT